jgi:cytochrome c2
MKQQINTNKSIAWTVVAGSLLAAGSLASVNNVTGDPDRGKTLYQACQACHSIDENDLGPRHRGVVGRRAGSVEDYVYSKALKNSGLTWDESTLDRFPERADVEARPAQAQACAGDDKTHRASNAHELHFQVVGPARHRRTRSAHAKVCRCHQRRIRRIIE